MITDFDNEKMQNFFQNLQSYFQGLQKFKSTDYQRKKETFDHVMSCGSSRLLHFRSDNNNEESPILLMIPSLINKYYILDLEEKNSLMDYISSQGILTYIIEFNNPIIDEYEYQLEEYINVVVKAFIEFLYHKYNRKIILSGYCIGGILATSASILFKKYIEKLVLIATPWRFTPKHRYINFMSINKYLSEYYTDKILYPHMINLFFNYYDHKKVIRKFQKLSSMDPKSSDFRLFIATEHWLGDGIAITKKLALEIIDNFYNKNLIMNQKWFVSNQIIKANHIDKPTLLIIPSKDKIVPLFSSIELANQISNKNIMIVESGHIGMIVRKKYQDSLWQNMIQWMKNK